MSFIEVSHTADVKIRATAPTLETLFSEAFAALMQVLYGPDRKGGRKREIRLETEDHESLLREFLSEVLFIAEVDGLVFSGAEIHIDGCRLVATLDGEPFDRTRHALGTEVKGISYSGLAITHDTNGYILDIVFDV
ncbi:MAG: archease [Methanoregulaceae archaeon]|nr:MAG: archease [Methanoregulaceae archaeon]